MRLTCEGAAELFFCDNDTNVNRLYGQNAQGWFKDGVNDGCVHGEIGRRQSGPQRHQGRRALCAGHSRRRQPVRFA